MTKSTNQCEVVRINEILLTPIVIILLFVRCGSILSLFAKTTSRLEISGLCGSRQYC